LQFPQGVFQVKSLVGCQKMYVPTEMESVPSGQPAVEESPDEFSE